MKLERSIYRGILLTASCGLLTALAVGCGQQAGPDPSASAQTQEIERLRAENQELAQARADNEEVQRLRQENDELPKIRSQYQEASRLKKENEQLRQQIAKISPAAAAAAAADSASAQVSPGAPNAAAPNAGAPGEGEAPSDVALAEGHINEGDDIMIEPRYLKQLLPEFDWEKLGRKDPLGIKALLERDGVQITNVAQLKEYGITNFVIQRAQPPAPATPAPENR